MGAIGSLVSMYMPLAASATGSLIRMYMPQSFVKIRFAFY